MASSSAAQDKATPGNAPGGGTGFPARAAIAAVCAVAVLLAWHFWKRAPGGGGGLAPGIFRQAFSLPLRHQPAVKVARAPLNGVQGTSNGPPPMTKPGALPPVSAVLVDDSGALDPFFAALWHLEQARQGNGVTSVVSAGGGGEPTHADGEAVVMNGAPGLSSGANGAGSGPPAGSMPDVVTVLHYGDSPTTADLITGDTRALLQARFGDAGHGFNLPAKPWAWYGHRDVTISDKGWKALTPVGSMREGVYGLGGATLVGSTGAKSTLRLADAGQTAVELSYFDEPGGGSFSVSADGAALKTIATDGADDTPTWATLQLPTGTRELALEVTSGTVKMLGVDFRKGSFGVVYDSMGLNGATTSVMARGFNKTLWPVELQHARPALVVINYGTNESSFGSFVTKGYENELRMAVAKVRGALPNIPILIMSPMDRGERAGLNDIQTMETIPQIVAIQKRVAADLHCGFFDTFDAMGGAGTMSDWYTGKPRLVSADLIHPTPQGALIVATKLVDNLSLGYDRWKRAHGFAVGPEAVPGAAVGRTQGQGSRPATSEQGKTATRGTGGSPAAKAPAQAEPKAPATKEPEPPTRLKTPEAKTPDTTD